MKRGYLFVFLALVIFAGPVMTPDHACAQWEEHVAIGEEELTQTVSTNDTELEAEAARLGVPAGQTKRYVVEMKSLNKNYQAGALTQTEYVGAKRNIIENLR